MRGRIFAVGLILVMVAGLAAVALAQDRKPPKWGPNWSEEILVPFSGDDLPPGLAKKQGDFVPPGWVKKGEGWLPPGLAKKQGEFVPPGWVKKGEGWLPPGLAKKKGEFVPPGLTKKGEGWLPSGLAKQGRIPPGHAKRLGVEPTSPPG